MKMIFIGYLLGLTLLTACSEAATDKLTQELRTVKSWTATSKMVADSWVRGAVPKVYAKQTLKKAQQELQTETDNIAQIESSTAIPQPYKLALLGHIKRLAKITEQMSTAVEQENYSVVAQSIKDLSLEGRTLDSQLPQQNKP
ncbi:MAG: hypothetical protein RM368_04950 [Nostoc sp. DedSLP03]|uniref:hypothetical protein n=1 Tax=Nostoc sp. DedSLP03 TaxID=3075400 RepID=UPI002AD40AC2|nr:hypothetical protein [Nostoc sp. DedSLP03]MDZ7964310.1 hypothetical protein [Nostoc sp. DedSLP03]